MERLFGANPALQYLFMDLRTRAARVRSGEKERGASAVEWVVITFIVVGLTVAVGFVISTAIRGRGTEVGKCIDGTNGANTQQNC